MNRLRNIALSILVLAFVALPSITSSQNERSLESQASRGLQTRFKKVPNAIPNRYIVVLDDDVADDSSPREVRLERVTQIANDHALAHLGKVDYIYETALKGYAIELPNEAAAVAISRMPQVQWVEEDQRLEPLQTQVSPQPSPPWGLDAIDGNLPAPAPDTTGRNNGSYIFHGDGTGVNAYVLDTGINTLHSEFGTPPFAAQATQAADCIRNNDCRQGPATGFADLACGPNQGTNNTANNDCWGHGTHVAATLGGNTYGVAKGVNIRSVKVCSLGWGCPASAVVMGVNWVTSEHTTNSATPKVVNMSLGGGGNTPENLSMDQAVTSSINSGVTYVIAAGNSNVDASTFHPAAVEPALTVGAVDWNANRWITHANLASNYGPRIDLWAPGVFVLSAQTGVGGGPLGNCQFWNGMNTDDCADTGTSMAAPHVAGAVAIYLQNRTGLSNCAPFPITGPAPQFASNLSTCPDRVNRYLKANAILDRLNNSINVTTTPPGGIPVTVFSPNRFLWSVTVPTAPNPIVAHRFFVWGLYADMLNREPDHGGLQFHVNQIETCMGNPVCLNTMRGIVAANFVRSPEFGGKGGYIANLFNIVFGQRPKTPAELNDLSKVERPHFNEFISDMNFLSGTNDAQISLQKTTLALAWLGRSEVQAILPSAPADFVLKLETTAGVTLANRQTLINSLIANNNSQTRAEVLRAVAEHPDVVNKFVLQNFITMQYIGHLRREPEDCHGSPDPANCGYIFHYNRFGSGDPGVIQNLITQGFIESPEYRRRFGPQ